MEKARTRLTPDERQEIVRLASVHGNYAWIAEMYNIVPAYVAALKIGNAGRVDELHGYTEEALTEHYTAPPLRRPHMIPGLTVEQLMGGRARNKTRRVLNSAEEAPPPTSSSSE